LHLLKTVKKFRAPRDYTILSFRNVCSGKTKHYFANVLLNRKYSKPEIVNMVKDIIEELKNGTHKNCNSIEVVWLYLYLAPDDLHPANWICQSQWIDKNLEPKFAPTKIEGENIGNEIILMWKDEYEEASQVFDSFRITKEDFLEKLDNILLPTKDFVERVILLTEEFKRGEVKENDYINSMKELESKLTKFYLETDDMGLAPYECADLSQQFQNLMAAAHNIILVDRNRLFSSIMDYRKELLRLVFELEKVHFSYVQSTI